MSGQIIPLRPFGEGGEVELKLIGAVLELEDRHEIIEGSGLVRADFLNPRAAVAWEIIRVMSRQRKPISATTVCSRGRAGRWLSDADLGWLNDLEQANTCSKAQALQIAEDVRTEARRRSVLSDLRAVVDGIERGRFSPSGIMQSLEVVQHSLAIDFAGDETADGDLMEINAEWDDNVKAGATMVRPTGIRVLDQILNGGRPRNLIIFQGKPGAGKNALVASIIKANLIADPNYRPGIMGLESGTRWLARRWQAEDLNLQQNEVGSRKLTREEAERKSDVDAFQDRLLKRVLVFRNNKAPGRELVRRALRWSLKFGLTDLFIDNLREVKPDPRSRQEYHLQIADTIEAFRDFGYERGVTTNLLVHDTEQPRDLKPGEERAPHPDNMQGGKDPGARARAVVGLYRFGNAYRATVTKNETGPARWPNGPTCEFSFNYDAGTMNPEAGRLIDLDAERAQLRREQRERSDEESVDAQARRLAIKARRKGATPETPPTPAPVVIPPQAALDLGVVDGQKPDGGE